MKGTENVPFAPTKQSLAASNVIGPSTSYQNTDLDAEGGVSRTSSYDSTETAYDTELSKGWVNFFRGVAFMAILGSTFLLAFAMASDYPTQYIDSIETAHLQQASSGGLAYSSLSSKEKSDLFKSFKKTFNKIYSSNSQEDTAYANFKEFLKLVDDRNENEIKKGGKHSAVHGVTKFADLSEEEFKKGYLTFKKNTDVTLKKFGTEAPEESKIDEKESQSDRRGLKGKSSTETVDWSGIYTTPVNDQGYCGSCWAFSAVQQLESDAIRAGYMTTDQPLSVQELVSCDTLDYGCEGGYPVYGYKFIYDNGGIVLNSTYPYTSYYATVDTCESKSSDLNVVTLTDFYYFKTETAMKTHVQSTGPLSVCIDASTWSSYTSGILSTCSDHVNHCVQAVGINSDDGYWIVRNSWGTEWGELGYIYLKSDENLCDITYLPTYVSPSKVSTR